MRYEKENEHSNGSLIDDIGIMFHQLSNGDARSQGRNGGKGSIVGTFGGVLAYGILNNILSWIGLGTYTKYLVQGIVFLFIVWLNTHSNRKMGKA